MKAISQKKLLQKNYTDDEIEMLVAQKVAASSLLHLITATRHLSNKFQDKFYKLCRNHKLLMNSLFGATAVTSF